MLFSSQLPNRPSFDVLRDPVDRLVKLDQAFAKLTRTDVPGLLCVVDQRVAGSPPERIVVQILLSSNNAPFSHHQCRVKIGSASLKNFPATGVTSFLK